MRVRMRALLAGPAGALEAGRVYDLDEQRARGLIASGAAAAVDQMTADEAGGAPEAPSPSPPQAVDGPGTEERLREWTVMDLRNYASDRKIDLGEATRKLDIIAAILAAERG